MHRIAGMRNLVGENRDELIGRWLHSPWGIVTTDAETVPLQFQRCPASTIYFSYDTRTFSNNQPSGRWSRLTAVSLRSFALGMNPQHLTIDTRYLLEMSGQNGTLFVVPDELMGAGDANWRTNLNIFIAQNGRLYMTRRPNLGMPMATHFLSESDTRAMGVVWRDVPLYRAGNMEPRVSKDELR